MAFPIDHKKLERVRESLKARNIDALLVRAPDNVLYLTNYWPMKGYAMAVFPCEGESTLIVIEPQMEEARRSAWTDDIRSFRFYDPRDPRPPTARSLELALSVLRERGLNSVVGVELSQGSQICDRMVGEPTVFTQAYFEACLASVENMVDAAPLLAEARTIKTTQEVERMRLANDLAAEGLEYAREHMRAGMTESQVAAMIEGRIHHLGVGYRGKVEMARAFSLVWSGPGIATFTATGNNAVRQHEPTLVELWVCADGYWTDLTKNLCPDQLTPEYDRLLELLLKIFADAIEHCRPGASLPRLDALIREGLAEGGYPGQPSHPVAHGVGARAHEPPFAHQAGGGTIEEGMVLAVEPGAYWPQGGGLRLEDCFLITKGESEQLCSRFPDDFRR